MEFGGNWQAPAASRWEGASAAGRCGGPQQWGGCRGNVNFDIKVMFQVIQDKQTPIMHRQLQSTATLRQLCPPYCGLNAIITTPSDVHRKHLNFTYCH